MFSVISRHDRDTKLDRETRAFLERGFGEDLSSVTLSLFHGGNARPRAWAVGERVHLDARLYRPETHAGRTVLAHEVAHVLQKRRARAVGVGDASAPLHGLRVEGEAHAAAACVAGGGTFTCSVADRPGVPRYWAEAGHYYTIFLVLLAAGLTPSLARRLAFCAQFPDEVFELDAKWSGIMIGFLYISGSPAVRDWTLSELHLASSTLNKMMNNLAAAHGPSREAQAKHLLQIQRGLHCLNGGYSATEQAKWKTILERLPLESFAFGLAIHGFGDSFAHSTITDRSRMYPGLVGHLIDATARDPEDADKIHVRRDLYRDYALALYDVVSKKDPKLKKRLEKDALEAHLNRISGEPKEERQIARILAVAGELHPEASSAYRPENEPLDYNAPLPPFAEFQKRHKQVTDFYYREALRLAALWAK